MLAEFIASSNRVDLSTAKRVVADYVEGLSRQLQSERSVWFEGLGRLLLSRTGDLFFVQDADARIFPDSDCLEAISMRNLSVASPADATAPATPASSASAASESPATPAAASSAATPASPDAAATVASESTASPTPADAASPAVAAAAATPVSPAASPAPASLATASSVSAPKQSRHLAWPYVVLITLAVLLILAFVALAVLGRTLPEYVDPLLYNSSQLEIINTVL